MKHDQPALFGPLVESCAAYGIPRSTAFELVAKGLLNTFLIGARRYVMYESLWDLPRKLADPTAAMPR